MGPETSDVEYLVLGSSGNGRWRVHEVKNMGVSKNSWSEFCSPCMRDPVILGSYYVQCPLVLETPICPVIQNQGPDARAAHVCIPHKSSGWRSHDGQHSSPVGVSGCCLCCLRALTLEQIEDISHQTCVKREQSSSILNQEGPSTQYLSCLFPNTTKSMVSGTKSLKHWVLGPSG